MKHSETLWNTSRGERKRMQDKDTQLEQIKPEQLEPITIYKNNILALVDDVKNDPQFIGQTDEELKNNKAFFPVLVNYIYNSYIGELLGNKHGKQIAYKDIEQLDYLFNIYTELVYKYKWNNRPLIIEFSIFTGINKNTFYNWLKGSNDNINNNNIGDVVNDKNGSILTRERSDVVQKWLTVCEQGLVDGSDTIKDIFILKAKYGYREASNDIQITVNHKNIISADDLPALLDLQNVKK